MLRKRKKCLHRDKFIILIVDVRKNVGRRNSAEVLFRFYEKFCLFHRTMHFSIRLRREEKYSHYNCVNPSSKIHNIFTTKYKHLPHHKHLANIDFNCGEQVFPCQKYCESSHYSSLEKVGALSLRLYIRVQNTYTLTEMI